MSSRQTRRSFSVRGTTYVRFKRLAARLDTNACALAERIFAEYCDAHEEPAVAEHEVKHYPTARRQSLLNGDEHISAYFTF